MTAVIIGYLAIAALVIAVFLTSNRLAFISLLYLLTWIAMEGVLFAMDITSTHSYMALGVVIDVMFINVLYSYRIMNCKLSATAAVLSAMFGTICITSAALFPYYGIIMALTALAVAMEGVNGALRGDRSRDNYNSSLHDINHLWHRMVDRHH